MRTQKTPNTTTEAAVAPVDNPLALVFADARGKIEIEIWESAEPDSEPVIMLSLTPPHPTTEHYALNAVEARMIAEALLRYADMQDGVT